jgi:hypothetical protein
MGDVDHAARHLHRTSTDPRATGFSPLTARSSVDLPDPDRPIRTRISPSSTSSVQSCTPRTWVVAAWMSSRVPPASASGSARAGAGRT